MRTDQLNGCSTRQVRRSSWAPCGPAFVEMLELRVLLAMVEWDAGGDGESWADPLNWSGDAVPTAIDDVVIGDSEELVRITGGVEARSLFTNAEMTIRGGLTVSADVTVNNRITMGTLGGDYESGSLTFRDGAFQSLAGIGEIIMLYGGVFSGSAIRAREGVTLTIGSGIVVRGGKGLIESLSGGTIINEGVISADLPGRAVRVAPSSFGGVFINRGTIAAPEGVIELTGTTRFEESGTFSSNGGAIRLMGTIDNTGRILRLDQSTGDLELVTGRIEGGRIETSGGARLVARTAGTAASMILASVHLAGDMLITANAEVRVSGSLRLDGRAQLGEGAWQLGSGRLLFIGPEQSLSGTGEIAFAYTGQTQPATLPNALVVYANTALTIESGITISGYGGAVRTDSNAHIVSSASLRAEGPGVLTVTRSTSAGTFVNHGRLDAATGATLDVMPHAQFHEGTILAGSGGRVRVRSIPVVPGGTLLFEAAEGTLQIENTIISDGAIASLGGVVAIGNGVVLDGATLNAPTEVIGYVDVRNGLTVNAPMRFVLLNQYAGFATLRFIDTPQQALSGPGLIDVAPGGRGEISAGTGVSLEIGEGPALRGESFRIWTVDSTASLICSRALVADVEGKILTIGSSPGSTVLLAAGVRVEGGSRLEFAMEGSIVVQSELALPHGRITVKPGTVVELAGLGLALGPSSELWMDRGELRNTTLVLEDSAGLRILGSQTDARVSVMRDVQIVGQLQLSISSSRLHLTGSTTVDSVLFTGSGGGLYFDDGAVIDCDITVDTTTTSSFTPLLASITPSGSLTLPAGRTIRVTPTSFHGVNIGNSSASRFVNMGTLDFQGRASSYLQLLTRVRGDVQNSGTIDIAPRIAVSLGRLTNEGRVTLGIAGDDYMASRVHVEDGSVFGGTLRLDFQNGYMPPRGTIMQLFLFDNPAGEFDSVIVPPLADPDLKSVFFDIGWGFRLIVTHIADINNDLSVNEADVFAFLTDWFAGGGDFDGNGERSIADIFVFLSAWHRGQ